MRLGHNMYSLNIYKNYKNTLVENSKALGNVSTGMKLNSAKDNPNKIGQSDNLKLQILARNAAQSNIQDTTSMLQTFDGALQEMNNNISRLKQLAVYSANETNTDDDRVNIQKEIDQILNSIDDLANNTDFNGIPLSKSAGGTLTDPENPVADKYSTIGDLANEKVKLPFYDVTNKGLGLEGLDVTTRNNASSSLEKIEKAINIVSRIRSKYGSLQSRLDETYTSMDDINQNFSSAQSSIADADIAEEMLEYARTNILYQSSISLMAQSNKFPQDALNILANVR
ncbi:flagellin [uncultured Clostridium sp.]|uniref:flagellin n=1 Tax=uncultured Clostridium sp. TaxID=59620 RepID=UPI0025D2208D|nr:flagellin [uncultured Clostridium sp.]